MKKNRKSNMRTFSIKRLLQLAMLMLVVTTAKANNTINHPTADPAIEGRWDLTVDMDGKSVPSWLEVRHSGLHMLTGSFVGAGGSARPVSRVNFKEGKISFTLPPQWEPEDRDIVVEGILQDGKLSGTIVGANGKTHNWTGVRAPDLRRAKQPVWGKQVKLFSGTDLKGWHTEGENQWQVKNGVLSSPRPGSNFISDQKFNDFKLHIEFRYPAESNSGVYLRGRYELQVADNKGMEPLKDYLGAIYGFIAPLQMVAKAPGEWQSYDVTLVGRTVSLVANGVQVICNQDIPGVTGGALDSNEGEPGPIMLQGDHGTIEYRNILITPAK
jgi:hypothetical protein